MNKPKIVDIPVKMEKFFGKGNMLHPNHEQVAELIEEIPVGEIATIDTLCKKLSTIYGTSVTCPMRTGNILKKMAEDIEQGTNIPFWRVIRKDKLLIKTANIELWAGKLEDEGNTLTFTKSENVKVTIKDEDVYKFEEE